MKKIFTLISSLFIFYAVSAQNWQETTVQLSDFESQTLALNYDKGNYFYLDFTSLKNALNSVGSSYKTAITLEFPSPTADKNLQFKVWESTCMEPALAAKYPDIKTYSGELVGNNTVTAKFDISNSGFHAMIFDGDNTYFIEPINRNDLNLYGCFYKSQMTKGSIPTCENVEEWDSELELENRHQLAQRSNGTNIKTYRLALACTHEYSVAVGGSTPTKASVLAQMVTIMNRVNGVYEREFAVHMNLVANTDTLIYLTTSDPYTNSSGSAMLSQNITTCNTRIGSANYDIGHVFSTGGGGVAYLSSVCNNSTKAGGVTGLPSPFGDVFAIDYVAHEMGHQFGSNHTFNSSLSSCNGNGVSSMAFEPGSGTTIMAYAGICGADNVQPNSNDYFHVASLRAISININSGTSSTCPAISASGNTPNTFGAISPKSFTIPTNTPFELTAPSVTDATADELLYCWEEWDLGGFGSAWSSTNNSMPFFRSFSPTTSPTRVFPQMNRVLMGSYDYMAERLPKTARILRFVLTTRDIYAGYGAFRSSDDIDTVVINAVTTTDSFKVTSQASATTWETGSSQIITWNVAGTTASPINASTVDIYLSTDSASTFPILLASAVANSGTATITVPIVPFSSKARVKVKATGNVFFQINRANITIEPSALSNSLLHFTGNKTATCDQQLSWKLSDNHQVSSIILQQSEDGVSFKNMSEYAIHSNESIHHQWEAPFDNNGQYFYRLLLNNQNQSQSISKTIQIINDCRLQTVKAFPNPLHQDYLNISNTIEMKEISIVSMEGKTLIYLQNISSKETQIDCSLLPKGNYIVKVKDKLDSEQYIKIVK